jgi:class 3 adenylate cyclase/DNA-binding NarL/FixJ family response regulator
MPRRVVRTYLFADLRDYTAFVETRGDAAAARLLRAYRSIVRAEVRAKRGVEIKTEGDSFYLVFGTPGDAVRCALGIARRAKAHNERHADLPLRIGVGINTGEAVAHDNAYVGSAVILASRLAQQAEAGRSLVTDTVRSLVRTGGLAPMRDLGSWKLKGVAESVHVYEVETTKSSAARAVGPSLRLPAMLLPPPLRGAGGLVVCPELVQRELQLAALLEHVGAAATGESRIVALVGEAGVGKTRLVRELARVAQEDGFYVFGGRSHASAALPYEPFIAALRPYAQSRGTEILKRLLGTLTGELRRLLPEIELASANEDMTIRDDERRERFLRVIQLLLEDAASLRPVVLVLEDMHEADAASRDLLSYLATTLHGGICVLFTYREEDVGPTHPLRSLIAGLDRERRLSHVALPPLDAAGVERMTKALLPERATGELTRAVLERSEGVPYYVEELLKTALDDASAGADPLPLPRTVRDSVQMRLARLTQERGRPVADLLEAAAIAAVPLGFEVLLHLSGRPEGDTGDDLAAAVEAQLLERPPTQQEIYQFRHTLTRDAVAGAISQSRQKRLHARVAEALEELHDDRQSATIARHFAAAGDSLSAVRYARDGARAAILVGAYAAAIDLLRLAATQGAGIAEEIDVLFELGAALRSAGRAHEAEEVLLRARDLTTDEQRRARIDLELAAVLRMEGQRPEAVDAVRRAIDALQAHQGPILAEALVHHADLAWAENDLRETARLAEDALGAGRRYHAPGVEVQALTLLGAAKVRLGKDEGLEHLAEATRCGRALSLGAETVDSYLELARAFLFRGRNEDALDAVKEGLALARARGLEFAQARLLAHSTTICVNLGRYEEARAFAEQSVALARTGTIAASSARVSLAHVMSDQGEGEAALALLDSVREESERNEPDRRVIFWSYRAQALLGLDRLGDAWESATRAVDLTAATPGMGMTAFLNAAEIAEARRDASGIEALSRRFEEYFAGRDTAPIRLVRLEIAAIRELCDGRDAARHFAEVADAYASLGARVRTSYRRASAAIARMGDSRARASARRDLAAQLRQLESFGARRYVAALNRQLRRRTASHSVSGPLTKRQQRVAVLISRGWTDRRIARAIGVSDRAASGLVRSVLTGLGVASRSQVAAWVAHHPGIPRAAPALVP